jgi:hypothetical protein
MAVRRRFKYYSGIRVDVPHLRSLESSVSADFDDLVKGLVTGLSRPYVIRGFNIVSSVSQGSPSNIQIKIADSAILATTATESGTTLVFGEDELNVQLNSSNSKVIGSWSSNAINYVALDLRRATDENSVDQTAYWAEGEKAEIQKTVPISTLLDYKLIITTSGFGNFLPLYKVYVSQAIGQGQKVDWIENCQPRLFRLGSGGLVPDPYHSFEWVESGGSRNEGNLQQSGSINSTSMFWKTGDFALSNMKDAFDATWTRIKELTGSSYWYSDSNMTSGQFTQKDIWWDSGAGSVITSEGSIAYTLEGEITTPGSEDYELGFPNKFDDIYDSSNWTSYYKGLVRIRALNGLGEELGRGVLNRANGPITLIEGLQGLFTNGDIIEGRIRLPITSLDVTAPNSGVAEITMPAYSLMDGTNSIFASDSLTFKGTIVGADDPAYNLTDVTITINGLNQVEMTYPVSTSIVNPASGNLYLDGIVYIGEIDNVTGGPVTFDEDIKIESVIGRKTITIAKEALSVELDNGNTVQDPIYGPGSFQLKNQEEVAFIVIERDLPVGGAGSVYASSGTNVQGPNPTYDGYYGSQVVRAGDYVKFEGSSDIEWRKVLTVTGSGPYVLGLDAAFSAPWNTLTGKLLVTRGVYGRDSLSNSEEVIHIANRRTMPDNPDVYWFAYRQDASGTPTVYLRNMELEVGEVRQINDNQQSNHLIYTGALSEANNSPTYTNSTSDNGFEFEVDITATSKEDETNTIHFAAAPDQGFISGDLIYDGTNTYTVAFPLSSSSVVVLEDIQSFSISTVKYRRLNYAMNDGDNLTVGGRKIDRLLSFVATAISRPVYDESCYIQALDVSGAGTIVSGDWLYNSGNRAWVLAGEGEIKDPTTGLPVANRILVHTYSGTWASGNTVTQDAVTKTLTANITDVALYGASSNGQDLKLPPNQRVSIPDNSVSGPLSGSVFPQAAFRSGSGKGGGELLVIANDTPRECGVDFEEIAGGPGTTASDRAKVRLIRPMPMFTRIRFRNLATFGVPSQTGSSAVSLQNAYNGSVGGGGDATIDTSASKPVWIRPPSSTLAGLRVSGIIQTDGAGSGFRSSNDGESFAGQETNRFSETWTKESNVKTHNNYSGSEWVQKTAALTTVGTSVTLAYQLALDDESAVRLRVTAVGRRDTGISGPEAQSSFSADVVFSRDGGGAVMVGGPITNVIGMSPNAYEHLLTLNASGNNAEVYVAGGTGQTCHWALTIEYQVIKVSA